MCIFLEDLYLFIKGMRNRWWQLLALQHRKMSKRLEQKSLLYFNDGFFFRIFTFYLNLVFLKSLNGLPSKDKTTEVIYFFCSNCWFSATLILRSSLKFHPLWVTLCIHTFILKTDFFLVFNNFSFIPANLKL